MKVNFATKYALAVWHHFFCGQLSDGTWENSYPTGTLYLIETGLATCTQEFGIQDGLNQDFEHLCGCMFFRARDAIMRMNPNINSFATKDWFAHDQLIALLCGCDLNFSDQQFHDMIINVPYHWLSFDESNSRHTPLTKQLRAQYDTDPTRYELLFHEVLHEIDDALHSTWVREQESEDGLPGFMPRMITYFEFVLDEITGIGTHEESRKELDPKIMWRVCDQVHVRVPEKD